MIIKLHKSTIITCNRWLP